MTEPTTAPIPAPPAWARVIRTVEQGREFSAGFGEETPGGLPPFPVEIVQLEHIDLGSDSATLHRDDVQLFVDGTRYTPEQATDRVRLIQAALSALG